MVATRAALFDLDGTLVDSERLNMRALEQVMLGFGRVLSSDERLFVIGHGWSEIGKKLEQQGPLPAPLHELMRLAAAARSAFVQQEGEAVLPGAVTAVKHARAGGRVAIVSGSSRGEIAAALDHLGLRDVIEFVVGAEDVSAGKPSPEGYLQAASALGVHPHDCIVFEDSSAGLRAARAAGMYGVAVAAGNFADQDQSAAMEQIVSLEIVDVAWLEARWNAP